MNRPKFQAAVYEAFFIGGYAVAASSGRIEKATFEKHKEFFRSMDRGAPLVTFCHLVDSYYGDRKTMIGALTDASLEPAVNILYYARNAFIHCAWDITKLSYKNQETALRQFCQNGGFTHRGGAKLVMSIDPNNKLDVGDTLAICYAIAAHLP